VPNALVNGGFAAAFGATAEPFLGNEPQPSTVLWCLAEGRTLAEASSHASPYVNYMWEAVGDPLMRVPYWFSAEPTVDFSQSEYDANEGDGAVMLTVRLSFASGESVEVDYATLDGTAQAGSDYVAKSGTLVFAPGAQDRTISITLLDDDVEETDAQFHVMLSNPVNATLAGVNDPADVIIIDDELPAPDDEGGDDGGGNGGGGGGGVIPPPPAPDADGDGVPDAIDACPDDPNKVDPGLCGCGVADSDRDGDDVPDCLDDCPDDVGKSHPGLCGCGMPENCGPIDPGGGGDPLPGDEVQDDEVPGDEPAEDDAPTNGMAPGNSDGEEDQSSGQPPSDEEAARGLCGAGMTLGLLTVTLLLYGLRLSRMRRR
jgi:hypothetical protein